MKSTYNIVSESMNLTEASSLFWTGMALNAVSLGFFVNHLMKSTQRRVAAILRKYPTPKSFANFLKVHGDIISAKQVEAMDMQEYTAFLEKHCKVRKLGATLVCLFIGPLITAPIFIAKAINSDDPDISADRVRRMLDK